MPRPALQIEGLREALKAVNSLLGNLEPKHVEKVLLNGAKIIAKEVRSRARQFKVHTGRLKTSVRTKKGKRRGQTFSSAFAAIDRKKAPHAIILERGARYMPAKPFFEEGVVAVKDQVAAEVSAGLKQLIKG